MAQKPPSRPKSPPLFAIDAAKRLHRGMTALQRKMAPAPAVLVEIISSVWRPHAIRLVAELGIADLLATGPRDVADLARATDSHEDALYRVLRALAHDGILAQPAPRQFALTPLSQPLRSDHPSSVRNIAQMFISDYTQQSWSRLGDAVHDGKPTFQAIHGREIWDYFEDHPEDARRFHASMVELTRMMAPLVAAAYDFGQHRTLVDVGGGRAALLALLLQMFPRLRGVNYDLKEAVQDAPEVLQDAGVADRCEVVTGSFFERIPTGYDAYMLKHIVHALDADGLERLFEQLRASLTPGTTLLLLEMLVPEDGRGTHPSYLDLQMLVASGGKERTATEYQELLRRHGFRLRAVKRTPGPMAVLVGQRV